MKSRKMNTSIQHQARRVHLSLSRQNPVESFRISYSRKVTPSFDMHYAAELGVVLDGRISRYIEKEAWDLGRGEAWVCGMWEPHGFSVGSRRADILVFHFLPEALIQAGPVGEIPYLAPFVGLTPRSLLRSFSREQRQEFLQIAGQVEVRAGAPDAAWTARSLLDIMRLLSVILRNWVPGESGVNSRPETIRDFSRIQPVLERLREAPEKPLSLGEAATLANLGRSRFSSVFQRAMGSAFSQYRLNLVLSHVAKALLRGDEKILSLARTWGFVDGSHLTRIFQKRFGCAPSEYRVRRGFR
jgi:AraC-like DNA-binding protein